MGNNTVKLVGEISKIPTYSHETYGEKFYDSELKILRRSGVYDFLPVLISEKILFDDLLGRRVVIEGQFRSRNIKHDNKSRLILFVFVDNIGFSDEADMNVIEMDGFICKTPVYRKTPLGRDIGDVLIAINRTYGRCDYIPCVCWGRNAHLIGNTPVGKEVSAIGRIQSREYIKVLVDGTKESRIAFEVSIQNVEVIDNE